MASVLDVNSEPTSGLQTFALFILFFFPGLALIVVGLRNAGRLATRQFGLDDWLITIAMFISVAETVFSYFYIKTNFVGIDESQIPPHDPTNGRIWNFAVQILYNPILALAKSSVLIFLLRLFGQKGGVRKFIICLNTFNILHMFGVFFALTFQCSPVAFAWDKTIRGGQCVEQRVLFTSNAVINIIVDFLILGLPLWIFVDLKIPKRAKIGLMFVFLLGFLVTITSIVRLVLLVQGLFGLVRGPGDTRNIGFITSAIETNLALITASAPALRPLLRSRDRGGWLPSLTRKADVEMASTEPELLASRASTTAGAARSGSSRGGKSSRGGSLRGGRRGGKSSRRGGKRPVALRDIRLVPAGQELRSQSPRSSEEETMTSNGIMRVSDVQREIDGLAKELVVVGTGSGSGGRGTGRGPRYPSGAEVTSEDIADLRRFPAARYLGGEGVYPDMEYRGERDYNEERLSRYGERRFGVVTPKTPKAPPPRWAQGGGQPF